VEVERSWQAPGFGQNVAAVTGWRPAGTRHCSCVMSTRHNQPFRVGVRFLPRNCHMGNSTKVARWPLRPGRRPAAWSHYLQQIQTVALQRQKRSRPRNPRSDGPVRL